MKYLKYLNFRAISTEITGNSSSIRSNHIPKKYEPDIQELNDLIEHWIKRTEYYKELRRMKRK